MRSSIIVFASVFAALGLLIGYAASSDAPTGSNLHLITDKPEYRIGEAVTFTAENLSSEALVFPNPALGITIRNVDTGKSYGIIAIQVLTNVDTGESIQVTWQPEEAKAGNYIASISTAAGASPSATAETSFRIR